MVIHYPEDIIRLSMHIGKVPTKVIAWCYNSNLAKQHRDIAFWDLVPDLTKATQPYKNPTDKRIIERMANGSKGARLYDWWEINQVKNTNKNKTMHPCQMPVEVMERIIRILPEGVHVIDPFCGSGTTGIACVNNGIDFTGIEIDKTYCEIAKKRIEDETAQQRILV